MNILKVKPLIILIFIFKFSSVCAQEKYWIFFNEKEKSNKSNVSLKTIENRKMLGLELLQETDYSPKKTSLAGLTSLGISIINTSKWLNAVSANLTASQIKHLKNTSEVSSIVKISDFQILAGLSKPDEYYLHYALSQINADVFINKGLHGEGVLIGVIDGGFYQAHKDLQLANLFKSNKIINYKDFINPAKKDFFGSKDSNADWHGTAVLKAIGGQDSVINLVIGLATKSQYYLARTESSAKESRIEEDCWVAALEWLDSAGVRLVNSSLGYAQGFTNPTENYQTSDMNGMTSVVAKAAKIAVNQKGMILVISAGNEGENKKWNGLVSTPGDVEEVISVGANDEQGYKMPYSSIGTDKVTFVKPNVTVFSADGTSLAAPIITGFVACMLQIDPALTSNKIKQILSFSGSMRSHPNNYVGYGYPDAHLVFDLLTKDAMPQIVTTKAKKNIKIASTDSVSIKLIHKKNEFFIVSQSEVYSQNGVLNIKKPIGVNRTTIFLPTGIKEIIWKENKPKSRQKL